jgi:DNA polymerase elongation subunit (family B)
MIAAFDIETIPNHDVIHLLPEPEASEKIKDPVKIAADIEKKRLAQIEKAGLNPLVSRVFCWAHGTAATNHCEILEELTDDTERPMVEKIMEFLGQDDIRIITHNGVNFDLPFVYTRAMVLNVSPAEFGAPPLTAWTKRYNTDRHYDLLKIYTNWDSSKIKGNGLDTLCKAILGIEKLEMDFSEFPEHMKTKEGRGKIKDYNVQDVVCTWELFERMLGTLFV